MVRLIPLMVSISSVVLRTNIQGSVSILYGELICVIEVCVWLYVFFTSLHCMYCHLSGLWQLSFLSGLMISKLISWNALCKLTFDILDIFWIFSLKTCTGAIFNFLGVSCYHFVILINNEGELGMVKKVNHLRLECHRKK